MTEDKMADIRTLRAQCKANTQFFEAFSHPLRQHGLNSNRLQDQSQAGEDRNQAGTETRLRGCVINQSLHIVERYYYLGVFAMDRGAHARCHASACAGHAYHIMLVASAQIQHRRRHLQVSRVYFRFHRLVQAGVLNLIAYSNYREPVRAEADALADGVLIWPEAPG